MVGPGSLSRVVTVVGVVRPKGPRTLGGVGGSDDDGDDCRLILCISGFLVGWTWGILVMFVYGGTPGSCLCESMTTVVTPGF